MSFGEPAKSRAGDSIAWRSASLDRSCEATTSPNAPVAKSPFSHHFRIVLFLKASCNVGTFGRAEREWPTLLLGPVRVREHRGKSSDAVEWSDFCADYNLVANAGLLLPDTL